MPNKKDAIVAFKPTGQPEPWRRVGENSKELQLQVWELPPPTKALWADVALAKRIYGVPTLVFGQVYEEGGAAVVSYAVTLPADQYSGLLKSFENVEAELSERFHTTEVRSFSDVDFSGIPDQRRVKHGATVIRSAVNHQHAMIDFYLIELVTEEAMKARALKTPPISPLARVWLAPMLMRDLIAQMRAIEE